VNLRSASTTLFLGVGGILLILVASWMLLLSPTLADTSDAHDAVSAAQDRNQVMATQVAGIKRQQEQLPLYQGVASDLEKLFPPTADQPGFFAAVTAAAKSAGIAADKVTTLSPTAPQLLDASGQPIDATGADSTGGSADTEAPAPTADMGEQTVSVTAEGTYAQIQKLLANLEKMDRAFLVSSLTTTGGAEDAQEGAAGTLTVSITGSTYVASPLKYDESADPSSTSAAR
jgi:Tfp pilus assembly protein PilO